MLHAFLIAAIFAAYMTLMLTLGAYIYRTGHPRADNPPDSSDEEGGLALLPLAA